MVLLTLVIGVLNLCLGYALAVHLGYAPPGLREAWYALSVRSPGDDASEREVALEPSVLNVWKLALATEATKMAALQGRLRECEGRADHEAIRECALELKDLFAADLEGQGAAAERFEDRYGESAELGPAGEELEEGIYEQLAQLETTIGNLKQVDLESDVPATGKRLLGEIDRVLVSSRRLWKGLHSELQVSPDVEPGQEPDESGGLPDLSGQVETTTES